MADLKQKKMIQYLTREQAEEAAAIKIGGALSPAISFHSLGTTMHLADSGATGTTSHSVSPPSPFTPKGSDGFKSDTSHVLIIPAKIQSQINPEDLNNVIVAGISVENATADASLQDGFYSIKLVYDGSDLTAELIMDGSVVKNAKTVRLIPTDINSTYPEAFIMEVSSAAVFLAGVCVGMAISMYIMK